MGCGTSFVKYVLFFFNLVFALAGLAMLGIGVALKLHVLSEVMDKIEGQMRVAPLLFIILGSIIFVIAFFGCCGAVRESHCMIVTYAVMLLVIIILQVILAVLVFIYNPQVDKLVTSVLEETFQEAAKPEGGASLQLFKSIEEQLGCCGTRGAYSYNGRTLPASCCAKETLHSGDCTREKAYSGGCIVVLSDKLETAGKAIGAISISVAVVEIIGAIFALCLANSIRNMDRRSRY